MIRVRAALSGLEPYQPGKPAEVVARARGLRDVVKLASNENPYLPLPSVRETIARAIDDVNRYPDDECTDLREALAARLEVEIDHLAVGCGSIDICYQAVLATVDPGAEIVFARPTFDAYRLLADLAGAVTRPIPLREQRHDLRAMADAITEETRLVILCNPNNPTGTAVGRTELEEFLQRVPEDLLVVIDEAYHEFVDDPGFPDGLEVIRRHGNVVVLRSFSKAYGLAGLRIGYGIANPELIAVLRKVHMPLAVNRLAQAAALASLAAEPELRERIAEIVAERARVTEALPVLGYRVSNSQANFVCLPVPGRSEDLAAACEARGVVVRPVGPDAIRVTIGTPRENDRFLTVLADLAERASA